MTNIEQHEQDLIRQHAGLESGDYRTIHVVDGTLGGIPPAAVTQHILLPYEGIITVRIPIVLVGDRWLAAWRAEQANV